MVVLWEKVLGQENFGRKVNRYPNELSVCVSLAQKMQCFVNWSIIKVFVFFNSTDLEVSLEWSNKYLTTGCAQSPWNRYQEKNHSCFYSWTSFLPVATDNSDVVVVIVVDYENTAVLIFYFVDNMFRKGEMVTWLIAREQGFYAWNDIFSDDLQGSLQKDWFVKYAWESYEINSFDKHLVLAKKKLCHPLIPNRELGLVLNLYSRIECALKWNFDFLRLTLFCLEYWIFLNSIPFSEYGCYW